jgi:hypothetical protein
MEHPAARAALIFQRHTARKRWDLSGQNAPEVVSGEKQQLSDLMERNEAPAPDETRHALGESEIGRDQPK